MKKDVSLMKERTPVLILKHHNQKVVLERDHSVLEWKVTKRKTPLQKQQTILIVELISHSVNGNAKTLWRRKIRNGFRKQLTQNIKVIALQ
jgi:hypothetical protein